eukprot:snap_masked-scaffold_16-processed-gene-4.18-mRNA-1 protein AED:1.00 eAED:1.00 QI:0/0/0/0/1/1/2/0/107
MFVFDVIFKNFVSLVKLPTKSGEEITVEKEASREQVALSSFALLFRFILYAQTLCLILLDNLKFPQTFGKFIKIVQTLFLLDLNLDPDTEVVVAYLSAGILCIQLGF